MWIGNCSGQMPHTRSQLMTEMSCILTAEEFVILNLSLIWRVTHQVLLLSAGFKCSLKT